MNNFEKACFDSCEKWVNSIGEIQEPDYSRGHIKKMNSIKKGNVRLNKRTVMMLVACMLILALNIVAFAYIGTRSKSKDLIFYNTNSTNIGGFDMGSAVNVRVKGAEDYKDYKPFDDLLYGYLPEGYEDILLDQQKDFNKLSWGYENGQYKYFQRDFEKRKDDIIVGRITAVKVIESNGLNVYNSQIFYNGDINAEEVKNDILENRNIEIKSWDSDEVTDRIADYTENGIHYYFLSPENETDIGGRVYWNYEGYLYELSSWDISAEELMKMAKDVK